MCEFDVFYTMDAQNTESTHLPDGVKLDVNINLFPEYNGPTNALVYNKTLI
jgi:hypothetical protein